MRKTWLKFVLLSFTLLILAACSSLEEKSVQGINEAKAEFLQPTVEANEEMDNIKLYKPASFVISETSDKQNIIFSRNGETYVLFINPKEGFDSRLHYDLLKADKKKVIIAEETFEDEGRFGFVAVARSDDKLVEVIVSIGNVKMTTLSKNSEIENNIKTMMEIVRSIEFES